MDKQKRQQSDYTNIRVLKTTHTKLKSIVDMLDVSWGGLIEAIADMSEEEVNDVLKPFVNRYKEKRFNEKKSNGGKVSAYMLAKRSKEIRDASPDEIRRFLDSL